MTTSTKLTPARIVAAFAIAVFTDLIQIPLSVLTLTGVMAIPAEFLDFSMDVCACLAESYLLGGFHIALAPTFLVEVIPFADMFPSWTLAVGAVVWIRKQEAERAQRELAASEPMLSARPLRLVRGQTNLPTTRDEEGA